MSEPPENGEILELCQSAADMVTVVAGQIRRIVGKVVGIDDLVSCGNEGLLNAARRFDPTRGVPFRAYAYVRIRGAMLDGVRASMPLPRRTWQKLRGIEALDRISSSLRDEYTGGGPSEDSRLADAALAEHLAAMATAMAIGMLSRPVAGECGELALGDNRDDPEQATLRTELHEQLLQAIAALPIEEATIIRRHYIEGQRFDRVADQLGLSKSWASRLHRRAIERLAKRLEEY